MAKLTDEQVAVLLQGINPSRVSEVQGMSHVEGYDIRATLIRMFGFANWDEVAIEPTQLLYEEPTETRQGKPAFKVAYLAHRRIVLRNQDGEHLAFYDGAAVGESIMPDFKRGDAHDMAIKTAETQALKRAAINLGDQFGLSLYRKGSTAPLVRKVVGYDHIKVKGSTSAAEHQAASPPEPEPPSESGGDPGLRPATKHQVGKIKSEYKRLGFTDRDAMLDETTTIIERAIGSHNDLTHREASMVIESLTARDGG